MKYIAYIYLFASSLVFAGVTSWEDSPNNWDNSINNWENSPNNWDNSPNNWENSPNNWNSDRIIRDNFGNAKGYAVPNSNGVINIYDLNGNRDGYVPK